MERVGRGADLGQLTLSGADRDRLADEEEQRGQRDAADEDAAQPGGTGTGRRSCQATSNWTS